MPSTDIRSISVVGDLEEIECGIDYRGKEDGYHRDETLIMKIVNKDEKAVIGIWEKEWQEIAPGIKTRREEGGTRAGKREHARGQVIRVYRSACPVQVQLRHMYRYVSYDDEGSSSSYDEWIRFEAADSVEKSIGE
ncbi:MAG: hypothetical protein WCK35_07545 [Chloroflexota bacterium]